MNNTLYEICPKCNSLPLLSIKRKEDGYYVHIKCTCGCEEDYSLIDYIGIIRNTVSTSYPCAINDNHTNNEDNKATTYCTICNQCAGENLAVDKQSYGQRKGNY